MKTITCVLIALLAVATANVESYIYNKNNNNNNNNNEAPGLNQGQIQNQQDILSLLENVSQPNQNQEQANIGRQFIDNFNPSKFQNSNAAQSFLQAYKKGDLLPRGSPFSTLDCRTLEEAQLLFELFYSANDFDTFYQAACFARDQINEGQFVYAFYVAVVQRPDTKYLALPAISEVYPQMFIKATAIKQVQDAAARGQNDFTALIQQVGKQNQCQNTMSQCKKNNNNEDAVNYFREDVALNENNFYLHIQYPFWFQPHRNNNKRISSSNHIFSGFKNNNGNKNNYVNDADQAIFSYRGEIFYTYLQQLLARYNLERVSNGLSEVEPIELDQAIEAGFNPELQYENGQALPSRPANMPVQNDRHQKKLADFIETHEKRLREAIDANALKNENGGTIPINPYYSTNAIGSCAESNVACPNKKYYGSLFLELLKFAGGISDPNKQLGLSASALENYQTMVRDPAFYTIAKRVVDVVASYSKVHFQPYSPQELTANGITIQSLDVSKLETYIDNAAVNINNAVNNSGNKNYKAYQSRLNHKPFTYRLTVSSSQSQQALVRVFIGPKVNNGEQLSLESQRQNFVLLDKIAVQLQSGQNQIERTSDQFTQGGQEARSAAEIKNDAQAALNNNGVTGPSNRAPCGLPRRLQLPKGSSQGQQFVVFAIISSELDSQHKIVAMQNPCANQEYFDWRPNLFPLDRSLSRQNEFNMPNFGQSNIFQQYFCNQNSNNQHNMNLCKYFTNMQNNVDTNQVNLNVPNAAFTDVTITHRSNQNTNDSNNSNLNENIYDNNNNFDDSVWTQ